MLIYWYNDRLQILEMQKRTQNALQLEAPLIQALSNSSSAQCTWKLLQAQGLYSWFYGISNKILFVYHGHFRSAFFNYIDITQSLSYFSKFSLHISILDILQTIQHCIAAGLLLTTLSRNCSSFTYHAYIFTQEL